MDNFNGLLGRYSARDESEMMARYGIKDVACADLSRGVLVGSVDLANCDGGNWHLQKPESRSDLLGLKDEPVDQIDAAFYAAGHVHQHLSGVTVIESIFAVGTYGHNRLH